MVTTDFSKIDTPDKAYVLGFIIADGVINSKYKVSISSKDFEILQKCKDLLGCDNAISEINNFDKRTGKTYKMYILQICSKKLVDDLYNLGVKPRKSWNSTFPIIDKKIVSHFLRGLFDGDGSISFLKNGQSRFSIIGSEFLIRDTQNIICEICQIKKTKLSLVAIKGENKIFKIYYGGVFQVLKILDFLYKDSLESSRLNRKYEKYLILKNKGIKKESDKKNYSSKYKGVHLGYNKYKKWNAVFFGKKLGSFFNEDDAAKCYNEACFKKFGDKNKLNKIETH